MAGMSLSSSFLPLLANNLDPSGVFVGLVFSSWFFSRIFIEIPAGIISDRIGRRRLLVIGLAMSFLGPIICSQANHVCARANDRMHNHGIFSKLRENLT